MQQIFQASLCKNTQGWPQLLFGATGPLLACQLGHPPKRPHPAAELDPPPKSELLDTP